MQRHKAELKGGQGLSRLATKLLRLLRADADSPMSSVDQEEEFAPVAAFVDISHYSQRENRSAWVNAERRKAEALMYSQRHSLVR